MNSTGQWDRGAEEAPSAPRFSTAEARMIIASVDVSGMEFLYPCRCLHGGLRLEADLGSPRGGGSSTSGRSRRCAPSTLSVEPGC